MPYRMPRKTRFFYRHFVEYANTDDPFTHDMDMFFHFIWVAHTGRASLDQEQLREQLLEDEFEPEVAGQLADIYGHCRDFALAKRTMPWVGRDTWNKGDAYWD